MNVRKVCKKSTLFRVQREAKRSKWKGQNVRSVKNKTKHIIKTIERGSIAEELELEPGDELLRVNGEIIEDVFDYHFQTNDTYLELTIRKKDGEEWDLEIEKEYDEEIGITFENEFMDQYRSCSNNCILEW